MDYNELLYKNAVGLLKNLITIPSFSKEEEGTAALLLQWFLDQDIAAHRIGNNIIAGNLFFDESKPTLLLNSHHDTVRPSTGYERDPFKPDVEGDKLYGLGSNDAGGCLVSLMAAFHHFHKQERLPFNIIMAATAEEEISGPNGFISILPHIGEIACAIVGEPTQMQMAVAERGLLVLDAIATGLSGHAARNEGNNAIYLAMKDIEWFQHYQFDQVSPFLGKVSMNVTTFSTINTAHNVIPDECKFTVDIRINEMYTHEEILHIIRQNILSSVTTRSTRLRSSIIPTEHPLVQAGASLGMSSYGSPTLSDKALMPFPALKLGPGDSARSHTADEFIYLKEIKDGINGYIRLIENLSL